MSLRQRTQPKNRSSCASPAVPNHPGILTQSPAQQKETVPSTMQLDQGRPQNAHRKFESERNPVKVLGGSRTRLQSSLVTAPKHVDLLSLRAEPSALPTAPVKRGGPNAIKLFAVAEQEKIRQRKIAYYGNLKPELLRKPD
ncbi:hypothetical protein DFS34DRAFT_650099 [Phlyctochytrium arcticum]|nr:hypothetical protein DFS34DRAFT_650099 [Phlyctochytrium arcticum]